MAWSTVGGGGGGGGTGDVTGPGSSVNNNFVFFNGTTGKIIKDSGLALDTDVNLAANSDLKVPSQKAVKAYVDALIAANNAMVFQGTIDCSTNPNFPAADQGDLYVVSVAGKIGGASGLDVEVWDTLICKTDTTPSGDYATVGSEWVVIQGNTNGVVYGPNGVTDGAIAYFDGVTGKLITGVSNFVWDGANSRLGVGTATPGERIHLYDGNMLLESPAEAAYMVKFEGDLNGNANISNPIWSLGRLVEGGVVDHSVFRFLFSSDDVAERSVFEVEDTGTAASVSDGTRRSHFEAFLNNGDTEPIFRASSAVGAGPEMGFQFGPGGATPVDVELYRNDTGPGLILGLGGSIKVFWYPDAVVHQPGVNLVFQNTTGSTPELRFQEDDTNGSNYVGFKAPASVAANTVWQLPDADGTAGQVLQTDGNEVLSWVTPSGGGGGSVSFMKRSSNDNGSSASNIFTWTTSRNSIGTDITYVADSVNGDYFLINTSGVYRVSLQVGDASMNAMAIKKADATDQAAHGNTFDLATDGYFGTTGEIIAHTQVTTNRHSCSGEAYISAGERIWANGSVISSPLSDFTNIEISGPY